uniref:Uncharacterized protein n=1 Tax=Acrobeloides nanus TaxID=290746 RepID=A0A914D9Z2_9BILA
MKNINLTLVVLAIFVACIHARYTFNSGSQLSLVRLLSSNSDSDPKLKEGVINWIKDQIDPELLKTWYGLSISERMCIQRGLILAKEQIEEEHPTEAMEFIENYCSSAADAAKKLYQGLREYAKKIKSWSESFSEDMPESIQVPMEKISKRSKWLSLSKDKDHQEENLYHIFEALEEILDAPEEDREVLARKHSFLAPFVTGNLHSDSIKIVQAFKKIARKETFENSIEFAKALKNWLKVTKIELMDYFETRTRPETNLPDDIDRKFTEETGMLYDIVYAAYAAPFSALVEMDISAEVESNEDFE